MFGNDPQQLVDRLIGERGDSFPSLGPDRPLAERESNVECEIVNVGHIQPPMADAPGRSNSGWNSLVKVLAAGRRRLTSPAVTIRLFWM
jgi:hypothetical protein